jgi:hypothetical protein
MAGCYEHGNEAPSSVKEGVCVGCRDNYYLQKWNSVTWSVLVFKWKTGGRNFLTGKIFVLYAGRFIMFSVITNIYNKKIKGPNLMELFTATGKIKNVFSFKLEMFDVCTTGDTAHIDKIFKFLPHTC